MQARAGSGKAPACSIPQYRRALTAYMLGLPLMASYQCFPLDIGAPSRTAYTKAYPAMVTELLRHKGRRLDEILQAIEQEWRRQITDAEQRGMTISDALHDPNTRIIRRLYAWMRRTLNIMDCSQALFSEPTTTAPPGTADGMDAEQADAEQADAFAKLAELIPHTLMLNADLLNRAFDYVTPVYRQIVTATAPRRGSDALLFLDVPELQDIRLTPFDRRVLEAACTIWQAGGTAVTPKTLARMIRGLKPDAQVRPEHRDEIISSVRIMQGTVIKLDYKAKGRQCSAEGAILPCIIYSTQNGGDTFTAIRLLAQPPAFTLAKARGHIITIPAAALAVRYLDPDGTISGRLLSNTPTSEAVKDYLLRRIALMQARGKRPLGRSNRILWQSVIDAAGGSAPAPKVKTRIRALARTCLQYWKAIGMIADYSAEPREQAITIQGADMSRLA